MIRLQNYYFSLVYLYKGSCIRCRCTTVGITHLCKTTILVSSQSGAAALRSATLSRDNIPVLSRCNSRVTKRGLHGAATCLHYQKYYLGCEV